MNPSVRRSRLHGTREAARLHRDFGIQKRIESEGGRVDVFGTLVQLGLPLLFRPLDGLLGAFVPGRNPGVIVTTQRMLSVQRFTGAHELGHFYLKHKGSLDGEEILGRSPWGTTLYDLPELEADAFAAEFLLPRWLFVTHARRQGWDGTSMSDPELVYQMSLRVGASYQATCRALERHGIIDRPTQDRLLRIEPRKIKQALLRGHDLEDWHPDVWRLTASDQGTVIEGGPHDLFLVQLKEHSTAGYLWNIDELKADGFAVVRDEHIVPDTEQVGAIVERRVIAQCREGHAGHFALREKRPWEQDAATELHLAYDLFGREEGMPRAERRRLEVA